MGLLSLLSTSISYLASGYLLFNVLYLLFFALAGHLRRSPLPPVASSRLGRICIFLPAYRADAVVLQTAPLAQHHAYDGKADVCVIADGLQETTIQALRQQQIETVEVFFEKSTKGKALLSALTKLPADQYDIAVILDVDNIMEEGFLNQVNQAFVAGYRVAQGHRTAKNMDSAFAVLDACSEEINNHIFRQGHASLGMSPSLIGSGMAFEYRYLQKLLQNIGDTAGEDKELDFSILRDQVKIAYLSEAYVYDEKIPNAQVFSSQRTRWIATQLEFVQKYFWPGVQQLFRGNIEFFEKVVQSLLLPRILLLGLLGILMPVSLVGLPSGPSPLFIGLLLTGTLAALLIALPWRLYNRQVAWAILRLPLALWAMMLAVLQIKKAKTSFMHTPHMSHSTPPSHKR
jgi:cellulose synthase/poly-beta-1,6-N-acetylglucosamine synthase-like glycosyltransferase